MQRLSPDEPPPRDKEGRPGGDPQLHHSQDEVVDNTPVENTYTAVSTFLTASGIYEF